MRRYTDEEVINEISAKYSGFTFVLKERKKILNKSIIGCTCKECGFKFNRVLYTLKDSDHLICQGCNQQERYKKIHERYYKDILKNDYDILSFSVRGNRSPITVRCKKCGTVFDTTYFNLQQNRGCKTCQYKEMKIDNADFLEKIKRLTDDTIVPMDTYAGIRDRIRFRCKVCGNIWENTPESLLYNNGGCPHCSKATSYPNKFMKRLLLFFSDVFCNIEEEVYLRRINPVWKGNHRFDFVTEVSGGEKVIIEMDGGLSHKDKTLDTKKDKFAAENGYRVIRIDCDYKDITQRFTYIKNKVIDSDLKNILDFSTISSEKWAEIEKDCLTSINKEIYDYCIEHRNESGVQIAKKFKKNPKTIYKILKNIKEWKRQDMV